MIFMSLIAPSIHHFIFLLRIYSGKPKLKFRSYNPQTEQLKEKKLPKAKPEEGEPVLVSCMCVVV